MKKTKKFIITNRLKQIIIVLSVLITTIKFSTAIDKNNYCLKDFEQTKILKKYGIIFTKNFYETTGAFCLKRKSTKKTLKQKQKISIAKKIIISILKQKFNITTTEENIISENKNYTDNISETETTTEVASFLFKNIKKEIAIRFDFLESKNSWAKLCRGKYSGFIDTRLDFTEIYNDQLTELRINNLVKKLHLIKFNKINFIYIPKVYRDQMTAEKSMLKLITKNKFNYIIDMENINIYSDKDKVGKQFAKNIFKILKKGNITFVPKSFNNPVAVLSDNELYYIFQSSTEYGQKKLIQGIVNYKINTIKPNVIFKSNDYCKLFIYGEEENLQHKLLEFKKNNINYNFFYKSALDEIIYFIIPFQKTNYLKIITFLTNAFEIKFNNKVMIKSTIPNNPGMAIYTIQISKNDVRNGTVSIYKENNKILSRKLHTLLK